MLTQYKNIQQIRDSITKSTFGLRFTDRELKLLNRTIVPVKESAFKNIELHVYSDETWITGNHKVTLQHSVPSFVDPDTNVALQLTGVPLSIDLYKHLADLKLTSGKFKFVINFFENLIGSYDEQYLTIDEISPDRTELRLRVININDSNLLQQLVNYTNTVQRQHTSREIYVQYLLNFGRNKTLNFVNSVVLGEYVYIKLYEALPAEFDVNYKCWIVREAKLPYIDNFHIQSEQLTKTFKTLSPANWLANTDYNVSSETGIKNWNDLLGSSIQTSQQLVDTYFSGSLSGVKLNIDYTDFNNFIFYSSAEERLNNFKYKLELLEYYDSQIATLQTISGSNAATNITDYQTNKQKLTGGFDDFEKFLYYQSSSKLTSNEIPHESPVVDILTGSYLSPSPKTNSTYPYALYSTTSSIFVNWFESASSNAQTYDRFNINKLSYALPMAVSQNESTIDFSTFVDMLGHHFDILYTYVKHASLLYKKEENPKLGVPNELLYSIAKQFGWNLQDGNQYQELWQYVLGTNEAGIPVTGSNTVGDPSVPGREMTYAVWRRIVNNLPLLLKSKGTKRSVQALLSCYGIPNSLISINEYGGPRIDRAPVYEKLNFDYALDLIDNTAGTVTINYSQSIGSYEMRFRTDNVVKNPLLPTTMNLVNINGNIVTLNFTRGTLGTVKINGTASADIELFDGGWSNLLLRQNNSYLDLYVKKSKYGKIVATVSSSAIGSFGTSGSILLGGTSAGASRLQGQLQEVRLWSGSLSLSAFENHTKAPAAYNGTTDAYQELVFRLPLTQKVNHTTTSSLQGVEPNASIISASFSSWTNAEPYDSIEETYYYDSLSIGSSTLDDNKIRIESSSLIGNLDIKTRAERSQYDTAPLDSKKLGIYFSPQTMIDEDIIAQLGFTELDSYIGDPGTLDKKSYPLLKWKSREYWKKYSGANDINSYIRIFTLFDLSFFKQLDQLLPARADKITGLLIQPNLLERNKDSLLPNLSKTDEQYEFELNYAPPTTADYILYDTVISGSDINFHNELITYNTIISGSDISLLADTNTYESVLNDNEVAITSEIVSLNSNIYYDNAEITSDIINFINVSISESKIDIDGNYVSYYSDINSNILNISGYDDDQLYTYITSLDDRKYDGFNYSYEYLTKSGSVYITASAPYWQSEAWCPSITSSIIAKRFKKVESYYSASKTYTRLIQSDVSEFRPTGIMRQRYDGAKMKSAGFNIKSPDTYDGGPVAEIIIVNPNQLVYKGGPGNGKFITSYETAPLDISDIVRNRPSSSIF